MCGPFDGEVALPDRRLRPRQRRPSSRSSPAAPAIYAGLVAKYWLEQFARVPVDIDVASEFRYRAAGARAGRAGALHQPVGRDRRHAGGAAPRRARRSSRSPSSSTCRPARWRARPTCCCRPMPGRRSASPRPRPSPASSRCSPRSPRNLARAQGPARAATRRATIVAPPAARRRRALNAALDHDERHRGDGAR